MKKGNAEEGKIGGKSRTEREEEPRASGIIRRPFVDGDMHRTTLSCPPLFPPRRRPQVIVIDLANNTGHARTDVPVRVTRLNAPDHLSPLRHSTPLLFLPSPLATRIHLHT